MYGQYTRPFGFGTMAIVDGIAYHETFETATAGLRLEGEGVRLDNIVVVKGGGRGTGGRLRRLGRHVLSSISTRSGIPVESLAVVQVAQHACRCRDCSTSLPAAAARFDSPRYEVHAAVRDFFVGRRRDRHRHRRHQHRERPDGAEARGGIAASRGVRHGHGRADRADGRGSDVHSVRHVAGSVSSRVRPGALALYDGGRQRQHPRRRRARGHRSSRGRHDGRQTRSAAVRLPPAQRRCRSGWRSTGTRSVSPTCG